MRGGIKGGGTKVGHFPFKNQGRAGEKLYEGSNLIVSSKWD